MHRFKRCLFVKFKELEGRSYSIQTIVFKHRVEEKDQNNIVSNSSIAKLAAAAGPDRVKRKRTAKEPKTKKNTKQGKP